MKRLITAIAVLCAILMFAAVAVAGTTDIKYYQNQDASWGSGVVNSVTCEMGLKTQSSVDISLKGKGFGALDTVPCTGVLGVGQVDVAGNLTLTNTVGMYSLNVKQTSLAGNTEMNQLGGLASTSAGNFCTGLASSSGQLVQAQNLNLSAVAALPCGFATHTYTGYQSATIQGGSF